MPDHLALRYTLVPVLYIINRGWDVAYILGIHKMAPLIIIKITSSLDIYDMASLKLFEFVLKFISGATDINCNHYIIDVYIYQKDKARCSL